MSHEFETGFFVTQPAWHGLGTVLPFAPSVAEALEQSGLDWHVGLEPLYLADGRVMTDCKAAVRSTDRAQLGTVGNAFVPYQNDAAFGWFQGAVDSGEVTIEAGISLRGGKRVCILASLTGGESEITPGDAVKQYVLLAHGHDGTLAIRLGFTSVRVVCMNTLNSSLSQDGAGMLKIKHTSGAPALLEAAKAQFDMQRGQLKIQADTFRMLARKTCSKRNLVRYIRETLSPGSADDDKIAVRNVDQITDLAVNGRGAEMARGTLWGAYNAVTEYVTHERGRSADTRVDSQWFGSGAQLASRALDVAVQFAEHAPTMVAMGRQAAESTATATADFGALLKKPTRIVSTPTNLG